MHGSPQWNGEHMDIFTLVKENIKHKKGAFKSIIFLMCIITAVMSAVLSHNVKMKEQLEKALDEQQTGDLVAWTERSYVETAEKGLDNNKDVSSYRSEECLALNHQDINQHDLKGQSNCVFRWNGNYPVFNDNCSGFVERAEPLNKGEVYLPVAMKKQYDCKEGSKVIVYTNFGTETFTVKGFIQEPLMGAYTIGIKHYFLCDSDYDNLAQNKVDKGEGAKLVVPYTVMHIFDKENSSLTMAQFKKSVNKTTHIMDYSIITESKDGFMKYTTSYPDICSGILYAFLMILFVIVIVTIAHGISSGIETDYENLGVLKAMGFSNQRIRLVYVVQYLFAVLIGALLGLVLSFPLIVVIGRLLFPMTGILITAGISFKTVIIPVLAMFLFVCAAVFLFTAKIGRISPVRAISGGKPSVYFSSRMMIPIGGKVLLLSLAFRQFLADRKRYIGTILISAILVFFMMTISMLANCMNSEKLMESMGIIVYDVSVQLQEPFEMKQIDQMEEEIKRTSAVKQIHSFSTQYVTVDGVNIYCQFYKDMSLIKNSLVKGREPKYDNEIVITQNVADDFNLKIGDKITLSTKKDSAEYVISGYYQTTNDMGVCVAMGYDAYKKIGERYLNNVNFTLRDKGKSQEVVDMLREKYGDRVDAEALDGDDMLDTVEIALKGITILIYLISVIFALVTVSMICSRSFIKEKIDIGIYKAVGFSAGQLRLQFSLRFLIVSMIGAGLGVVICLLGSGKLIEYLLGYMGITSFVSEYSLGVLLIPVCVVCLCCFVFSYIVSRKVKRIAPKELVIE